MHDQTLPVPGYATSSVPSLLRLRSGLHVPVRDLRAGPEQDVPLLADLLVDLAEIFGAMRRTHDVGMHRDRHHARRAFGVLVDLLELVHGALVELARLVMLDQHHRDVVAFLRVGNVENRLAARLHPYRLVVEHPVGDVIVAFLGKNIRRFPCFGESRPEPAAWTLTGRFFDHFGAFADIRAFVLDLLHVALGVTVADELPFAIDAGLHDVGESIHRDTVDVHDAGNLEVVVDLQKPPEADAIAVFVPAPVGDVWHRRAPGRRCEHRAGHCLGRVPFLDIGDGPHHHARALRQLQRLALCDGGIVETVVRQHADAGLGKIHTRHPHLLLAGSFAATPDIVQGMKLVRYRSASGEKPGLILDGEIFDLSGSFAALNPRAPTLDDIEAIAAVPAMALDKVEKGVALGPPLRGIGKIIGVGLNYRDHAEETGLPLPKEPTLFLKATSALCGPADDLVMPREAKSVDWEVELGVVIGKPGVYIAEGEALDYVLGYCVGIDFSERDFQFNRGGQGFKG